MHPAHGGLRAAEKGRSGVCPEAHQTASGHRGDSFVNFSFRTFLLVLIQGVVSNNVFLLVLYSRFYCLRVLSLGRNIFYPRFISWMQLILCFMRVLIGDFFVVLLL